MISQQLPVLQIVLPLVAAPLCVLVHNARVAWLVASAVSWVGFAIAVVLLLRAIDAGPFTYALGGWAAPYGIEYRIEAVNALVLVIVTGASAVMTVFARLSVEQEVANDRVYLFYALWMLNLTGLLGITVTGDAFNLFVFLEISSLSSYALVSLGRHRRALVAAFRYLVMGTVGATFILIGIGLLYMATGSLNMFDIAGRLSQTGSLRTAQAAFAFLAVGVGLKMALFPLHAWLPNAYTYSPSVVSAFLAATATKVAVYMWLRLFFSIFGVTFSFEVMEVDQILMLCAVAGIFFCSALALYQSNVKRLLAYSSVAQIGYMTLGISFVTTAGVTGAVVHLFNHALMKGALFLAVGCVVYRTGSSDLSAFRGLAKQMPLTMMAFVIAGLSLIGVPLTAGFISKWYLLQAALEVEQYLVAFSIVVTSLIALAYVWRVVEPAYFQEPVSKEPLREAPWSMLLPVWVLVIANVYFGVQTEFSVGVAGRAAIALLGNWQ